jgi:hypothetical protein
MFASSLRPMLDRSGTDTMTRNSVAAFGGIRGGLA